MSATSHRPATFVLKNRNFVCFEYADNSLVKETGSTRILSRNKRNSNITDVTDSQISIQKQMAGKQTHREPPGLILIKIQLDAKVCKHLFTAKSL